MLLDFCILCHWVNIVNEIFQLGCRSQKLRFDAKISYMHWKCTSNFVVMN